MATTESPRDDNSGRPATRRRYDSPTRRRRMDETRERIVAAGAELAHDATRWDWAHLTFRAVAEQAGIGERTVYRHFPTQRELHDAVMVRLAEQAGVDYDALTLDSVADTARRVFNSLSEFAVPEMFRPPSGTAFVTVNEQRRAALERAVSAVGPGWPDERRLALAATLDVLWSPLAYESLVTSWGLDADEAHRVLSWAIDSLVRRAADDEAGDPA